MRFSIVNPKSKTCTERSRSSQNPKSAKGFTLIELSIAMTLLALIAMTLYGAFYLGHRSVEKAQARSEQSQQLRFVGDLLAGYIRSTYPYRPSLRDPAIFFSGMESQLTFVSALSSGMGGRGMSEIRISWEEEGDGAGLLTLEEQTPLRLEGQGEDAGYRNRVVLSQGVRTFRMDYLDSQSEAERWVEQWDGREKRALPRAVRFNLRGDRGEGIHWVFPIMMSVLAP